MDNIELQDFLNFLSLACKINIKENSNDAGNGDVDLDKLISNTLIVKLFERYKNSKHKSDLDSNFCKTKRNLNKAISVGRSKSANNSQLSDSASSKSTANVEVGEEENLNDIVQVLKTKLSELLNEGIFDSILSYLIPNNDGVPCNKSIQNVTEAKPNNAAKTKKKEKRKKPGDVKCVPKNE